MSRIAFVNGRYVPHRDARVHVEDRGYQFADAVYEVCEVRAGHLVDARRHLDRLDRSMSELRMTGLMSRPALLAVLKRVDVALLNDSEATMLFETHSLPLAAEKLLSLGLKRAIIKKGSHGAQMFSAEGTFAVPAVALKEVKDPTGAGDTFAGALIGYLAGRDRVDEETLDRKSVV